MMDRTHELLTPAIKSLPKALSIPKNESNGHQASHLENETTKMDLNQHVSNLGDSKKEHKNFNNQKNVEQYKMAKDSKNKLQLPSVKGRKKGSTTSEKVKASKTKQKAPEVVAQKKRKTEKVTSQNENIPSKEKENEVVQQQTATISGEQEESNNTIEENPIITTPAGAYNQQNVEIVQTPSETVENQNIQAKENVNETMETTSNSVKGAGENVSKELKEVGEKMPQKRSASKSVAKTKAKAPKRSEVLPTNKSQKDKMKTKQLGQKRRK